MVLVVGTWIERRSQFDFDAVRQLRSRNTLGASLRRLPFLCGGCGQAVINRGPYPCVKGLDDGSVLGTGLAAIGGIEWGAIREEDVDERPGIHVALALALLAAAARDVSFRSFVARCVHHRSGARFLL